MQTRKIKKFQPFNTMLLTGLGLISKIVSVLFKIILIIIIGTVGIGYYQLTFPLFVFLFSISSVGIGTTLTMQIAEVGWLETIQNGGFCYAKKITYIASLLSSLILVLFAPYISKLQGAVEIQYIYYSVAISIVSVSLLTFYRAVLRGNKLIRAYAISDIVEQISKLILAMLFAFVFVGFGEIYAVIGVFIGISISAILTLIYIKMVLSKLKVDKINPDKCHLFNKSYFLKCSLIAGVSSILLPFVQIIDSIVVVRMLNIIGFNQIEATTLFGLSRGSISALLNLPNTIIVAIEFLLLPDLLKVKTRTEVSNKCKMTLSFALALGVFIGAMYYAFSSEILSIVYRSSFDSIEKIVAVRLLKIGAFTVVFSSISQIQSVVLQGLKKLHLPIISLCIASVIKILFEIVFIRHLGIYGAELSNVLFYLCLVVLNGCFLIKNKVYFGSLLNLAILLVILVWVWLTRFIYKVISFKINFVFAIILAIVMTSILAFGLGAFVYSKIKKKNHIKKFVSQV